MLSACLDGDIIPLVAQYAAEIHRVGQLVALCSFPSGPVSAVFRDQLDKFTFPAKISKQNDDLHRTVVVEYLDGDIEVACFSEGVYIANSRRPLPGTWTTKGVVVAVTNQLGLSDECLCRRTDSVTVFTGCECTPWCSLVQKPGCTGHCVTVSQQCRRMAPWGARQYAATAYEEACLQLQYDSQIAKIDQTVRSWHCT